MPGKEFLARMAPEFAQHAGSAHENAKLQAEVERLIARAEYEFCQVRRQLVAVLGKVETPTAHEAPAPLETPVAAKPAKAA